MRLSADGEIPDLDTLLESASENEAANDHAPETLAYCIHCGSANPDHARYCAKCGQPLIDADALNRGREKSKRFVTEQAQPTPSMAYRPLPAPVLQSKNWGMAYAVAAIARLGAIAAMSFMTFFSSERSLFFLPLVAGFLVEAVRNGKRHTETAGSALVEMTTVGVVIGLYATALYTGSVYWSWGQLGMQALLLLFWFLIEAIGP